MDVTICGRNWFNTSCCALSCAYVVYKSVRDHCNAVDSIYNLNTYCFCVCREIIEFNITIVARFADSVIVVIKPWNNNEGYGSFI